jgi:hypothetical protein
MATDDRWQKLPKGEAHKLVLEHVQNVERLQFDQFDRFVKLAALYDPNSNAKPDELTSSISENVVASNVDTVQATIATAKIRARFMTDGGDWDEQRRARQLEWYAEGLAKKHNVDAKCSIAFGKGAGVRGTGVIYVDLNAAKDGLVVEHVLADDMIADDRELRGGGCLRQIHRRRIVDRDDLIEQFPKYETEIRRAYTARTGMWAGYRPIGEHQIVVLYSWHLGAKRKCVTIEGCTLLDEKYEDEGFPFVRIVWSERDESWYGIGLAERLMGHQRVLNKSNWQIDRLVDRNAVPTTYVRQVDAKLAVKQINRAGSIAIVNGDWPVTPVPPAISPEVYKRVGDVKVSASEESGVARMLSTGTKPAGLDSGAALREHKDQTTQRFATQEEAHEQLKLGVVLQMLACCKKLGPKAPAIMRRSRFGAKKITWSKVDMGDVKVQIAAASSLARTPAGRIQFVMELAQAGIISTDSTKRLLQHPDLERELSLYTAALENVEHCLDEIADGGRVMPEPFMNLEMVVWRGQLEYLIWRDDGAPEKVLEALRSFVVQAAWMVAKKKAPAAANSNAMPMDPAMGAAPMDPMMDPAMGGMPPLPGSVPMGPQPTAALSTQAMDLRAG